MTNIIINVVDSDKAKFKDWPRNLKTSINSFEGNSKVFDLCVKYYFQEVTDNKRISRKIVEAVVDKAMKKSRTLLDDWKVWLFINSNLIQEDPRLSKNIVDYIMNKYGIKCITPHYEANLTGQNVINGWQVVNR